MLSPAGPLLSAPGSRQGFSSLRPRCRNDRQNRKNIPLRHDPKPKKHKDQWSDRRMAARHF